MLLPIFILCVSHLVLASPVQPGYDVEDIDQHRNLFKDFMIKYDKIYTAEEEQSRFKHFRANLAEIIELRKRNPFAEFDINKFADLSPQERQKRVCFNGNNISGKLGKCTPGARPNYNTTVPASLDFRDLNAVTPVQDQQYCGSCWAFSATGAVEGAFALKHKALNKLSEQQMVDCDQESDGCNGGFMHYGFSSLIEQGGQQLESDYPYQGKTGSCSFDVSKVKAEVASCQVHENLDEYSMKILLATQGPLAIGLDSSQFLMYTNGIISDCNYQNIDHGVLLVGYGEENDVPYWLIKNSWSAEWGDKGYVKVLRKLNCLAIGQYVSVVQVK